MLSTVPKPLRDAAACIGPANYRARRRDIGLFHRGCLLVAKAAIAVFSRQSERATLTTMFPLGSVMGLGCRAVMGGCNAPGLRNAALSAGCFAR